MAIDAPSVIKFGPADDRPVLRWLRKFNPYHDEKGRFTTADGATTGSAPPEPAPGEQRSTPAPPDQDDLKALAHVLPGFGKMSEEDARTWWATRVKGPYATPAFEYPDEERTATKAAISYQIEQRLRDNPAAMADFEAAVKASPELSDPQLQAKGLNPLNAAVANVVDTWAGTAADNDHLALAMQYAAQREFKTNPQSFTVAMGRIEEEPGKSYQGIMDGMKAVDHARGAFNQRVLRGMYDETQAELKRLGITELTVHRGMSLNGGGDLRQWALDHPGGTTTRELMGMPMQSWSASHNMAEYYGQSSGGVGITLSARVPASRVLSTSRSGYGSLIEQEYVLLDGPGKATIRSTAKPQDLKKFNPYHDELGRFATSDSASAGTNAPPEPAGAMSRAPKPEEFSDPVGTEFIDRGERVDNQSARALAKAKNVIALGRLFYDDPRTNKAILGSIAGVIGDHGRRGDTTPLTKDEANEAARGMQDRWAKSSADNDIVALGRQVAVQQEFGLRKDSLWALESSSRRGSPFAANMDEVERLSHTAYGESDRTMARQVYTRTQDELAKHGVKEVTLYRGMRLEKPPEGLRQIFTDPWSNRKEQTQSAELPIQGQPLTSWSSSRAVAARFANGLVGKAEYGVMLTARIPAERIFSTPRTGPGCLEEREYIVLDGPGTALVEMKKRGKFTGAHHPSAKGG